MYRVVQKLQIPDESEVSEQLPLKYRNFAAIKGEIAGLVKLQR